MSKPFKMRSGNSPMFKNMGSSPAKAGKKKGPAGQFIKGVWKSLPPGVKAAAITTAGGLVYSGVRKLTNCKVTNTGKKICKPRKIKLLHF